MNQTITLAALNSGGNALWWLGGILAAVLVFIFVISLIVARYRRCPSNRILVIYGRVGTNKAAHCLHGGGTFVWPLIQDYAYLSLEPLTIEIPLEGALSLNNIRVNVPSTFTVGISTDPVLMNNAAERLLLLDERKVREQAQDIILGQLRLVIATLSIEEINKDREKFMALINENVAKEINKVGLDLINVNIRDITDESGYIAAIGKRAAAEAINRAKVDVAQQERDGASGEAMAFRERTVAVANESATAVEGEKKAEQLQRIAVAAFEATAVTGENTSKATIAEADAKLGEIQAEAQRRAQVASAKAREAILVAEREQELARMSKEELAPQEIEKKRIEIAAAAEAEKRRIEAKGEADAILLKFQAEAAGTQKVLEAKAEGYRKLIEACGINPQVGPTLLLIEQLPQLVAEQVKAISALKIDKITVWDTGAHNGSGRNTTTDFLAGFVGSLPKLHELAAQAGIELPNVLGKVMNNDVKLNKDVVVDGAENAEKKKGEKA